MFSTNRTWPLLGSVVALMGCQGNNSEVSSIPSNALKYESWCEDWKLQCPGATKQSEIISADEWNAIVSVVRAFLKGPSSFEITRSDLQNRSFKEAVSLLGYTKIFNSILGTLSTAKWKNITVKGDGFVKIRFEESMSVTAKSGLILNLQEEVKFSLGKKDAINVSGVTLSDSTSTKSSRLVSIAIANKNKLVLETSDFAVSNAPFKFVSQELDNQNSSIQKGPVAAQSVLRAIGPMKDWLDEKKRELSFGSQFFATLREKASTFTTNSTTRAFLADISYMRIGTTGSEIARATFNRGIQCQMQGETPVTLNLRDVRLTSVDTRSTPGVVYLRMTGVDAVGHGSFLAINVSKRFQINTVAIQANSITVYDTPKGNVTIPFGGPSNIQCANQ